MRKIRVILFSLLVCCLVLVFYSKTVNAVSDFDEIEEYIVTVEPDFHDGSLKINVFLKWKVLDDKTDGPLSWIKIGVPNCYTEGIKAKTDNIKKIRYYEDNGSYIRIDLDRKYYQDEELTLEFSWIQTHMYILQENIVFYDYNPGYFDNINVKHCEVRWKIKDVANISPSSIEPEEVNGYYVWSASLGHSEYIKVNLFYDRLKFLELDPDKQYTDRYMSPGSLISMIAVFSILGIIVIGIIVYSYAKRDPYLHERGFIVHRHYFFSGHYFNHYYKSGVSSTGKPINPPVSVNSGHYGGGASGGCACACACACAGGGRAGCSMKDFYHTNLSSKRVINIIDKE